MRVFDGVTGGFFSKTRFGEGGRNFFLGAHLFFFFFCGGFHRVTEKMFPWERGVVLHSFLFFQMGHGNERDFWGRIEVFSRRA